MKKKTINSEMPIGTLVRVKDFLPSPAELAIPGESKKITISLKKSSIEFFKHQAQRHHTKYQRMIRELVDRYAMAYSKG
jgi:predicted DNA binding CopG/RHH family protein